VKCAFLMLQQLRPPQERRRGSTLFTHESLHRNHHDNLAKSMKSTFSKLSWIETICPERIYSIHRRALSNCSSVTSLVNQPVAARYMCEIQYFGTRYKGWQRENETKNSIVDHIEKALLPLNAANSPHNKYHIVGAGRTDAGVHSAGQVFHVDLHRAQPLAPFSLHQLLNGYFKLHDHQIHILSCHRVSEDIFHARHSCSQRIYKFRIITGSELLGEKNRALFVPQWLDCQRMQLAANELLGGQFDFSSFQSAGCVAKSATRQFSYINVAERANNPNNLSNKPGQLIEIELAAVSFLYHQVRNIVGMLVAAARGQIEVREVKKLLQGKPRGLNPIPMVSADGLYLVGVKYPPELLRKATELFAQENQHNYSPRKLILPKYTL
jgi:tRNA pseudouridine38-40 synthase